MEKKRKKPNKGKKQSNPLGTYNLLLPSTDKGKFCNISLLSDDSIPNSEKKTVWASCYGWLLISQQQRTESCSSYQFSVRKPESWRVINLPPLNLEPNQKIHAATLVSPPANPGSMVLLFEEALRFLFFLRFGDKKWTMRWIDKEIEEIGLRDANDRIYQRYITQCDGKLYAATLRTGNLMVIEENRSKNLKFRPLNCKLPGSYSRSIRHSEYLLDFCGQLCAIGIFWGGVNHQDVIDIEVSKLEICGNRMEWVKVENAKGHAFFLSEKYAFSCKVNESEIAGPKKKESEIEGGCVYFTENNRFYSVNIEDKSVSVSLPLENLLQSENLPFLAMPDFRFDSLQAKSEPTEAKVEDKVIENNGEEQATEFCDIPFDMLELIAQNLYVGDYIKFQSVCKSFRVAIPPIKCSEVSFKLPFQSLCPWFVFPRGNIHNFIDSQLGDRYFTTIPKSLSATKIRYSKGGRRLMYNPNSLFFYHPFIKQVIELPQKAGGHQYCWGYGLSSSPASIDSILVGIGFTSIQHFCRREGEWKEYMFPDYDFETNYNSAVYLDGAFYFIDRKGKIGVFRWDDDEVSWNVLRELRSPCRRFFYNYLVEYKGSLLSVFVENQFVHVYKLKSGEAMAWERVTNIGNHTLFLSPSSTFSVIPNVSYMQNKVYFPKLFGKEMVYYCLSTSKFYNRGNKEAAVDFKNTTEFLFSSWIEPIWK